MVENKVMTELIDHSSSFPVLRRGAASAAATAGGLGTITITAPTGQQRRYQRLAVYGAVPVALTTVTLWHGAVGLALLDTKDWAIGKPGVVFTELNDVPFIYGTDLVIDVSGYNASGFLAAHFTYQPLAPSEALWPELMDSVVDLQHDLGEIAEDYNG